ncbi:MAG: alpha-N-arabinofuranosidase [Chloroflexi bacterium]|nr:alpha-N-arabinofuranosidase [Chloroflexota bacterium]
MARIKIDLDRTIGTVDARIFSGFIEHMGRCIYGGIFEEGSPLGDERGFRRDVMQAIRGLRLPILRWPGGNFSSGYHWVDGVGPRDRRPRRMELAWRAEESNRFGTDEFVEYCRAVGTEPYICVNIGSGTMDEAQAWVEYCNGTGNTYWANLRRQNGHADAFGVKYWGLGNEIYGSWQIGSLSAEDYVKKAVQFAHVMKRTDPSIELVGCGKFGLDDWDRIVLEGLAAHIQWYSIHIYTGSEQYYTNVFVPHQAERALRSCRALIDRVRYAQGIRHPIHVAYDEWNVWYRARANTNWEEQYDLSDSLAAATYLNVFVRHCQTIRMANISEVVNIIAPIMTSPQGLYLQTTYHPLQLYAQHTRPVALDAYVECETYDLTGEEDTSRLRGRAVADLGPFKLLDVAATRDADGRQLTLAVVNRDRDRDWPTTIHVVDRGVDGGVAYEVNGRDPKVRNSFEEPDAVVVRERPLAVAGQRFEYTFPAHSTTVLCLELSRP